MICYERLCICPLSTEIKSCVQSHLLAASRQFPSYFCWRTMEGGTKLPSGIRIEVRPASNKKMKDNKIHPFNISTLYNEYVEGSTIVYEFTQAN